MEPIYVQMYWPEKTLIPSSIHLGKDSSSASQKDPMALP